MKRSLIFSINSTSESVCYSNLVSFIMAIIHVEFKHIFFEILIEVTVIETGGSRHHFVDLIRFPCLKCLGLWFKF